MTFPNGHTHWPVMRLAEPCQLFLPYFYSQHALIYIEELINNRFYAEHSFQSVSDIAISDVAIFIFSSVLG